LKCAVIVIVIVHIPVELLSDLLLLLLNGLWAVNSLVFLLPVAITYFHRQQLEAVENSQLDERPRVSIIIPARDEARNIGQTLQCITQLDYPEERIEVIVVNDRSTDATAEIVSRFAAEYANIRLLDTPALPDGWTGKSHGCQYGANAAHGDWLAFIDADTYVKPPLIASAIAYAESNDIELLSLIPFQIVTSFQERISLPGIFLGFASVIDFRRVNDPNEPQAVANGQFLLFSRSGYQRIGSHQAIRQQLSDDLAFARRAKELGLNFRCLFADRLIETRMYRSLAEVWGGFSRNAVDIMRATSLLPLFARALRSLLVAAGLLLLPATTLWLEGGSVTPATVISIGTLIILVVIFWLTLRELRIPSIYLLTVPFGLVVHGVVLINSYLQRKWGIRAWKGRAYTSLH
jgi:cellulose synthase/poly-beta-1,6-N-acetylglucosamine synthase-like glycosyltransferase